MPSSQNPEAPARPLDAPNANGAEGSPKTVSGSVSTSKPKVGEVKKQGKRSVEDPKDGKMSGAEMKKKAKEEKAARRAKEKQEKQGATQDTVPAATQAAEQAVLSKDGSLQKTAATGPKQQLKRTGSASTTTPKPLPIRSAEAQVAPLSTQSKEKSKRAAFFSHLYSGTRRTTIAGAGKDVHPAVLSLGIQISDYTVCGSNARCIGMLLAFKKV